MGLAEENLRRKKQVQDNVAWKYVGFIDDGNPHKPCISSKLDNVHEQELYIHSFIPIIFIEFYVLK